MARITVEADNGASVTLIVSPSDALKVLLEYQSKYPNTKSGLSLAQFINKWCEPNEKQADDRLERK